MRPFSTLVLVTFGNLFYFYPCPLLGASRLSFMFHFERTNLNCGVSFASLKDSCISLSEIILLVNAETSGFDSRDWVFL